MWNLIKEFYKYNDLCEKTEQCYETYNKAVNAFNEVVEKEAEWFRSTLAKYNDCKYYSNRSYDNQFYIVFDDNSARIVIYIEEVSSKGVQNAKRLYSHYQRCSGMLHKSVESGRQL